MLPSQYPALTAKLPARRGLGPLVHFHIPQRKSPTSRSTPKGLHRPIHSLLLSTLTMFKDSTKVTPGGHTGVTHAQLINILDQWLVEHSQELEREYTNCPRIPGWFGFFSFSSHLSLTG